MENTAGKARLCRPDRQNALKETHLCGGALRDDTKNGRAADYFGTTQSDIK